MNPAAVIGLGDISPIHLAAIAGNPDIELCAVCDIDPEAGQRAPEGVPFYTDYEEMLREAKPDCVHVCLPHYLHYPVSKYFAEHGVNVFCEKPVALNTAQAKEFAALETAHPEVHIGICLQNRLNESVEMLKSIIESAGIAIRLPDARQRAERAVHFEKVRPPDSTLDEFLAALGLSE